VLSKASGAIRSAYNGITCSNRIGRLVNCERNACAGGGKQKIDVFGMALQMGIIDRRLNVICHCYLFRTRRLRGTSVDQAVIGSEWPVSVEVNRMLCVDALVPAPIEA
jgi:hypothetical protein